MSDENPSKILDQLYTLTGADQPTTPEGKHERMLEVYRRLNALKRGFYAMENALVALGSSFESAARAADRAGEALSRMDSEVMAELRKDVEGVREEVYRNTQRPGPSGLLHAPPEVAAKLQAAVDQSLGEQPDPDYFVPRRG